jgi:hypothetical protein
MPPNIADDEANDDEHPNSDTMWQETEFVNYWCDYDSATGGASSGSKDRPGFVDDDEELAEFYKGYVPPRANWETYEEHLEEEVELRTSFWSATKQMMRRMSSLLQLQMMRRMSSLLQLRPS